MAKRVVKHMFWGGIGHTYNGEHTSICGVVGNQLYESKTHKSWVTRSNCVDCLKALIKDRKNSDRKDDIQQRNWAKATLKKLDKFTNDFKKLING